MSEESEIERLRAEVKRLQGVVNDNHQTYRAVMEGNNDENRRLRDACRSTNRGITRLSKRCQSQAKKIGLLTTHLQCAIESLKARDVSIPEKAIELAYGRRPTEKAT